MKKIKRRSVLCLILVLIQVFFVFSLTAIAADETSEGTSEGTVLSLSKTTLVQDLTAEVVAEKDEMYIKGQRALSMVAFAAEQDGQKFDLYLYLFSPTGFDDVETIRVTITEKLDGKARALSIYGTILDRSKTLVKVVLDDISSYNCGYDAASNTLHMSVNNVKIGRASIGEITYTAFFDSSFGKDASVNGSYDFVYDLEKGIVKSNTRSDVLELKVRLASERVTNGSDPTAYKQINTAMMLIPNKYFNSYGDLDWVEYVYSLYDKVPMLITSSESLYSAVIEGERYPLGYISHPIPEQLLNRVFIPSLGKPLYNSRFAFLVSSIYNSEDDIERELGMGEILKRFYLSLEDPYKETTYQEYIHAANIVLNKVEKKTKDDFIETVSYEDAATFFDKLFDGRLFLHNIDDSVKLPAIQSVDQADLSLSDDELSSKYCIDVYYIDTFRDMAEHISLEEDGFQLVLMRYLLTDYTAKNFSAYYDEDLDFGGLIDGIFDAEGYLCYNAIIQDFQILKLCFKLTDEFGKVQKTVVYTDNPPQDFVDPPESGDKLTNEKTEPIIIFLKGGCGDGNGCQDAWSTVVHVLVALAIAFALFWLLRFIALVRDAFGRRYPKEDKPPRERRRRK